MHWNNIKRQSKEVLFKILASNRKNVNYFSITGMSKKVSRCGPVYLGVKGTKNVSLHKPISNVKETQNKIPYITPLVTIS